MFFTLLLTHLYSEVHVTVLLVEWIPLQVEVTSELLVELAEQNDRIL